MRIKRCCFIFKVVMLEILIWLSIVPVRLLIDVRIHHTIIDKNVDRLWLSLRLKNHSFVITCVLLKDTKSLHHYVVLIVCVSSSPFYWHSHVWFYILHIEGCEKFPPKILLNEYGALPKRCSNLRNQSFIHTKPSAVNVRKNFPLTFSLWVLLNSDLVSAEIC